MNDNNIRNFYKEVEECLDGEYKIILEPKRNLKEEWIEYDQVKWEMEDGIKDLVDNLLKEKSMSIEDKILEVYKYICLNYIYDVNVLYFFRKDKSDINNVKYIDFAQNTIEPINNAHNLDACYQKEITELNTIKCDTYKENKDWIVEIKSKEESKTHAIIKFY